MLLTRGKRVSMIASQGSMASWLRFFFGGKPEKAAFFSSKWYRCWDAIPPIKRTWNPMHIIDRCFGPESHIRFYIKLFDLPLEPWNDVRIRDHGSSPEQIASVAARYKDPLLEPTALSCEFARCGCGNLQFSIVNLPVVEGQNTTG